MNTLFDKIWDSHVVSQMEDGPVQLYIDRLYCHEVTSPQAFDSLRERGIRCFRPERIVCMPDHNTPTHDQDKAIEDPVSKAQVDALERNAAEFGLRHYGMMDPGNGIIHVVGPEKGLSLPGMTIVCGDSHTSTHGAVGAVAFGIGTSEVEMVMASQCILQQKPKTHTIKILENSSTDYSCDFIVFRIINNKLKIYFCEIKSSINFLDKALEQIASSKLFIKYLIECYNYYCGDNNLFKGFSMEQDTSYFYIYPKINSGNKSKIKNYAKSLLIKQVEINEKSIAIIQDTEKFFNEK